MAEVGKYLYCIIPCQEERLFDEAGVGDGAGPVGTVCRDGLAAVASDYPAQQYGATRRNMLAHERVLERVMREFPLLPVRFGTVAESAFPDGDILKLLEKRAEEFRRLLGEMTGKVELGLKVFWRDEKAVFQALVAENAEIRRLRDSLEGKPPGATHFAQMRLGEMVAAALNHYRAREATRIMAPLRCLASGARENLPLLDRMVVSAAFLVDREREPEFDRAVGQLSQELGERIAFKYTGPAPPYNFVNLVVNWAELD